jgi:hypothetical protein
VLASSFPSELIDCMTSISSEEAFPILRKWLDDNSRLQIVFFRLGKLIGSTPGLIKKASPNEESAIAFIVVDEQAREWHGNFRGVSSQYGEALDSALFPEYSEGKRVSYLFVEGLKSELTITKVVRHIQRSKPHQEKLTLPPAQK